MDFSKSFFAIIVVCIDHQERFLNRLFSRQNCLAGSPGLCSVFRAGKSLRQILQILIYISYFCNFFYFIANNLFKFFFNIFADNKNYFIKSRL